MENKLKRAVIKEEMVALTGDFVKALLLQQFIYWSQRTKDYDKFLAEEKKRMEEEGQELNIELSNGWIYKSAKELSDELMIDRSETNIRSNIKFIVENEWLHQRRNPKYKWDKTIQYRVNIPKIQKDLLKLGYILDEYPVPKDLMPPNEDRTKPGEDQNKPREDQSKPGEEQYQILPSEIDSDNNTVYGKQNSEIQEEESVIGKGHSAFSSSVSSVKDSKTVICNGPEEEEESIFKPGTKEDELWRRVHEGGEIPPAWRKNFHVGDALKFDRFKRRKGAPHRGYYPAAKKVYEALPESTQKKIDAYVEYELSFWDFSGTRNKESVTMQLMYEYMVCAPCFVHYYLMDDKKRQQYKKRCIEQVKKNQGSQRNKKETVSDIANRFGVDADNLDLRKISDYNDGYMTKKEFESHCKKLASVEASV